MKVKCKNCLPKEGIEVPDFSQSEKSDLYELKLSSPIKAMKHLVDEHKLSLLKAKYMVGHINEIYGKCNRCKFNNLKDEYCKCPKCKALNFNWKV